MMEWATLKTRSMTPDEKALVPLAICNLRNSLGLRTTRCMLSDPGCGSSASIQDRGTDPLFANQHPGTQVLMLRV